MTDVERDHTAPDVGNPEADLRHQEDLIDESLEESFPASDAPSANQFT